MNKLTHVDENGRAAMVDVSPKEITRRVARASGRITMKPETVAAIRGQRTPKGDPLETARLAGIMAAKQTGNLIPLCHPLGLDRVEIDFVEVDATRVRIEATAAVQARTGVEMEAMTAVSVAALTLYDMCKSVDRGMVIERVQLLEKSGGKSGHYLRNTADTNPQQGDSR